MSWKMFLAMVASAGLSVCSVLHPACSALGAVFQAAAVLVVGYLI